jgi:iron(III) transport system substrate-binding protein
MTVYRRIGPVVLISVGWAWVAACDGPSVGEREVVVYTSLDQRYSEPILRAYQERTGVITKAVYDTEATKTTGLVNRLLAERDAPRSDVFWNSEIVRTIALERAEVLAPYRSPSAAEIPEAFKDPEGYWTGFAARVRVIAVNPELVPEERWPRSFDDLARPEWKGRFAMAYPLFGTTSTHVAALFAARGPEAAKQLLESLVENGAQIVDGNSTARDRVVAGSVPVAITDSDDVAVARTRGEPIRMIFPGSEGEGTLVIPNTVALIAGSPHPDEGKALIDYLLSAEVEEALASAGGAQIPLRDSLTWPAGLPPRETLRAMEVDFEEIASRLDEAVAFCRDVFVR